MSERIPVTLIEWDRKRCSLTYGVAPCTAAVNTTGEQKCFNTLASCQDQQNYNQEIQTLRFSEVEKINDHPYDHIPSIVSASTMPTRINVGAREGDDKATGRRGTLTVTMRDLPYNDRLTDPYVSERAYNPLKVGTFWSKMLARDPFYNKDAFRLLEGYEGQLLHEMQTRHYLLDKIDPPDSGGNAQIRALDALRLADDDLAVVPPLSRGELVSDIDENENFLTVTNESLSNYTQGFGIVDRRLICIGDEVIRWAAVTELNNGNLQFTGLERAIRGTNPQSHSEGDTVQVCADFETAKPWEVADGLLRNYASVPADFIDFADWSEEAERWLGGYTVSRTIVKPTGVNKLVGELSEQSLFFIWYDDRARKIRLQAVRPSTEDVPLVTERDHIKAGTFRAKVKPELRASEVWVSFLPINVTDAGDDETDYRRTLARVDPGAASPQQYGERKIYRIFSQWIDSAVVATLLATRMVSRYRDPPLFLSFEMDAKDRHIDLGQPFDILHRSIVGLTGAPKRTRYQVISQHEPRHGDTIKIEAQRFDFDVGERRGNWMVFNAPSYEQADPAEREAGFFWAGLDGKMPNGDDGYLWS